MASGKSKINILLPASRERKGLGSTGADEDFIVCYHHFSRGGWPPKSWGSHPLTRLGAKAAHPPTFFWAFLKPTCSLLLLRWTLKTPKKPKSTPFMATWWVQCNKRKSGSKGTEIVGFANSLEFSKPCELLQTHPNLDDFSVACFFL